MQMRRQVLQKEPLCRTCRARGIVRVATECDHIVPLWDGGEDTVANRQPLCDDCHREKTNAENALRGRHGP